MKKTYLFIGIFIIFIALFSACATVSKANDCTGLVPVPNKDWVLLDDMYTQVLKSEGDSKELKDEFEALRRQYPDPTTVISRRSSYVKNKDAVYFRDKKMPDACPNTFEVLSEDFAKDAFKVFYEFQTIEGADPKTFVYLGLNFAKDRNSVYLSREKASLFDAASFVVVDKKFFKDKNHVYFFKDGFSILKDADPETFQSLKEDGLFAKDKNTVFIDENKFQSADSSSFQIVSYDILKDKNHVYCRDIYSPQKLSYFVAEGANPVTFKDLGKNFSTDDTYIFYTCKKVDGIDPKSFQMLPQGYPTGYIKDKSTVYIYDYIKRSLPQKLPADPETFKVISLAYSKDKDHVYYLDGEVLMKLDGVNAQTFQVSRKSSNSCASDGKNFYMSGKRVEVCSMD